jgi:hypothetical protein
MRASVALRGVALLVSLGSCDSGPVAPERTTVPVLLSVEPNLILIEDPPSSAVLRGEGFTPTSSARVNGGMRSTAYVAADELHMTFDAGDLENVGQLEISVASAEVGGLASGEQTIHVVHANPLLLAVAPETVPERSRARLLLRGDHFADGMTLVLDGLRLPVSRVSGDSVAHVDVPKGVLTHVGRIGLRLTPAAPGLGPLNELEIEVVQAPPEITEIFPASADVGSGPLTLTVHGRGFDPAGELRWNRTARAFTFVDSATLRVTVETADLGAAGTSHLDVSVPSVGMSEPAPFAIVPTHPTSAWSLIGQPNTVLAPDPIRDIVYATVPSGPHAYANELIAIDAATKTVAWSVPTGLHPISLAVSEDGAFAYVGLGGAPLIVRIDLATRTRVLDIPINVPGHGPLVALDIATLPGSARTIAASLFGHVAVFDDAVMRPAFAAGSQRITATSDPHTLFGLDPGSAIQHFRRYAIDADGVWEEDVSEGYTYALGGWPDVVHDGGLLFTNLGDVVDPYTFELLADFVWSDCQVFNCIEPISVMRPDVANGRIHYFRSSQLITKDATSFTELGALNVAESVGSNQMVRYGSNGLAIGGGESILFIESTLIGPE